MRILRAPGDILFRPSMHQNWSRDRKLTQQLRVKLFVIFGENLVTYQTSDVFATTCRRAFMMPDGKGNEIPVATYQSAYCAYIWMTVCTQKPSLGPDHRCNRGALLSEIKRRPCCLQIIFPYFVFLLKIHRRWLIS